MKNIKFKVLVSTAVVITGGFVALNIFDTATGNFRCSNTEQVILAQGAIVPLPSRPADQVKKTFDLRKLCATHTRICGDETTANTARVLEICQPYR